MTRTRSIRQTVTLPASPHAVYTTLVEARKHSIFSGAPARLVARPGGRFSHFGGALEGFVLRLEKDRRIVLAWRANSWVRGHYSIVEFLLTKVKGGTRVEFSQDGVPADAYASIASGWREHYWGPLTKYFAAD
ncbi:MAG: SRPBCC domain-containing protein [Thermoplasmata archaeon]